MLINLNRFTYHNPFSENNEIKQSLWTELSWQQYKEDILSQDDMIDHEPLLVETKEIEIKEQGNE